MDDVIIPERVIKYVKGTAIPKPENDQNTDDIVPARYLKEITFKNMGNYAYIDERFPKASLSNINYFSLKDWFALFKGSTVESRKHPFNSKRYDGATILIGGANFGCGSSREHAARAFSGYEDDGIGAIIAESFAEIFFGNCTNLGIVGVTVSSEEIAELAGYVQRKPSTEFYIDLTKKVIGYDGNYIPFDIPEGGRQAFLAGTWDAMALLQQNEAEVEGVVSELPYFRFK